MFAMFLVYANSNFDEIKALFVAEGDAINFANPNGWGVAPVLVTVPFYVAVNPV